MSKTKSQAREKLYYNGLKNLNNRELLAIVLGSGDQKHSVTQLSSTILNKFPLSYFNELLLLEKEAGQSKLLDQLQKIDGIAFAKASKIVAAIELGRRSLLEAQLSPLNSPQLIFEHCSNIKNRRQEFCLAFFLNAQQELLLKKVITIGGLNFNFLEGREIFEIALKLKASQLILAHNHPSGNLEASLDDLRVSQKMAQLALAMGMKLEDHLIVGKSGYFSIREHFGELAQLDCDFSDTQSTIG